MQKVAVTLVLVDLVCVDKKGGTRMGKQECSLCFYVRYVDTYSVEREKEFETAQDAHEFANSIRSQYKNVQVLKVFTETMELEEPCPFCYPPEHDERLKQGEHWWMRWDKYPVSQGHILLTPKKHIHDVELLSEEAWAELPTMITNALDVSYVLNGFDGYNLGINYGKSAGQTIDHLHIHIIPRVEGDCENPRGGVRNVKKPLVKY